MATKPLISVIIANYNFGRFLPEAIESILSQNMGDQVEIIICDGGSTDNSVEVIKRYASKVAWWCSEKDNGQSEAFNKGFAHARGRFLTWLNADDLLVPGALKAIVRMIKDYPECEWFTANFYRFIDSTKKISEIGWGPHMYPRWMQRRNSPVVVFGPSSIFSKALWESVGRIDESMHLMMDTDLWMRFIVSGVKQRRIANFVWAFRMHEASKTAEFGAHTLNEIRRQTFAEEWRRSAERTGYRTAPFWRIALLIIRIMDGSLLRRYYYMKKMIGTTTEGG